MLSALRALRARSSLSGYLVVENAITDEQLQTLREAMDTSLDRKESEDAASFEPSEDGGPAEYEAPPNRLFGELLEEDERFEFLLDAPPVLSRMKAILGNAVQLHSATARCTKGGAADQDWHRDVPWAVAPEGTPYGAGPGQINCGYFLDELTMDNGPIVLVRNTPLFAQ